LVAFVGTVLVAGACWEETFAVPVLAQEAPELYEAGPPTLVTLGFIISFGAFSLGWLLFGVAALRARLYPRVSAVLLIIGAVLSFVSLPFTYMVFGVAVPWMRLNLLSGKGVSASQPTRAA
jgi:hypothetical protein